MLQINQGPAHSKIFSRTWESEGSSIKKAQQAVANKALTESTNVNNNPDCITPTPAIHRPLDPKPFPNNRANYNFQVMYNQRYHSHVGNNEFWGEGNAAMKHNAAMKALQNGESGKDIDDDKDANKSEISLVFEIVIKESGPPHMKSFVTRVSVGKFSTEGEGNSKKLSKKRAATTVLQELKKLPPLPVVEKAKLFFKKHPETIVKFNRPKRKRSQIMFCFQKEECLDVENLPKKKKSAAVAMLLQLGYKASINLQDQLEKTGENKGWSGPTPGFPEPTNNTPKGILHLSPDVYQEMEASHHKVISGTTLGYLSPRDMNQPSSSLFSMYPTSNSSATMPRELLMNGTSSTAEATGLKGSSPTPPCSPVQPSKQLEYLARIQGFQV
uniref:DRBM domain-containing protein n=1 Tax=Pan troglodytes TaxID=9598 RepID=A0A2I3RRG6_PANTR